MVDELNELDSTTRQSYALGLSVGLHIMILFLMLFNFSWQTDEFEKSPPVLMMVDLTKVKLADKTNLPPKVEEKKKEAQPAAVPQPVKEQKQKEDKTPTVKKEPEPKPQEPAKPKEAPAPKEAVQVQEPKKAPEKKAPENKKTEKKPQKKVEKPKTKPQPKKVEKKQPPKKTPPKKATAANSLQSLLASVEKVRKPANPVPAKKAAAGGLTGQEVNKGIEGGTGGSLLGELTISEKDLIANKIRQCWNVNAGVEGAEEMIIELRAFVNKDGRIRSVKILNMKNDPVFRSMAESAKRAIFVCDAMQEESPFKILAEKHPQTYSSWKELYLRMNPVDGGVF